LLELIVTNSIANRVRRSDGAGLARSRYDGARTRM